MKLYDGLSVSWDIGVDDKSGNYCVVFSIKGRRYFYLGLGKYT